MNWTQEQYDKHLAKINDKSKDISHRPERGSTELQKHKEDGKKRDALHANGNKKKDKGNRNKVDRSIFANFRFENFKRRDLDGAFSTLADSVVRVGIIPDDSISELRREFAGFTISDKIGVDIILIEYYE